VSENKVSRDTDEPAAATGSKPAGKRLSTKHVVFTLILLTIGVVTLCYGIDWWKVGRFIETTDDAYVGGDVTVISPHVSGYIAKILVNDNELVRAGQPLLMLENRDFTAVLDASSALIAERKASLDRLLAQRDLEQVLVGKAEADLAAKNAAAEFGVLDAERYRLLALTQAGSQQNAQRSHASLQEARSAVAAAKASLLAAKQMLVVIGAQFVESKASLAQAEAQQRTATLNSSYTEIRSPIDGYVADRSAHPGSYVTAGTQLLSVVPATGLWVEANFKEDQLRDMKPGELVEVVADVTRKKIFHGRVQSIAPATGSVFSVIPPQNATGNFTKIVQRVPVRIKLDDDAATLGVLRPGLSTVVQVDTRPDRGGRP